MIFLLLATLYAGRPLVDALHDLETKGLRLIYSDEVVTRQMVVKDEPRAKEPRQILDELLAPHDLRAVTGPRDTLLIVRAEGKQEEKVAMPVTLAEIVVTPSRFEILAQEPESRQFMSRDEVRRVPHLADDLYRAIARIPGTTSSDVTARPNIRGGAEDEVAVLLDGAEIYDPFHLKDLFRAFSTIDAEAVGAVDILTGGFPSEFGGRMSGVIDVDTLAPTATRTEVGVSLLNTRLLSQGRFGGGRGEWLLSLRRGYLREVLELIDDTNGLDPRYYDLLGKVQWMIGSSTLASLHVLGSDDTMRVNEQSEKATATNRDQYVWLNIRGAPSSRLFVQGVASFGQLEITRHGTYGHSGFNDESGRADDERRSRIIALKSDATFNMSPRNVIKGGVTLRRVSGRYDYDAAGVIRFTPVIPNGPPSEIARTASFVLSGSEVSAYVADRVRLGQRLVAEAGARLESETLTPDGVHISPRLNVAWAVGERTSLRAAWGRFAQPQRVYELQVEDGVLEFGRAQRAEHRVIGVDHALRNGATTRFEIYDKRFAYLRPRYENLFDRILMFPELRHDRVRIDPAGGRARGAELLLRSDGAKALSGWVSYARSEVTDRIEGRDVPRAWDQRDAITFSVNYRRGESWNFNLAGTHHTGWPITPIAARIENNRIVAEAGPLNSSRLPAYRRFDFRASRNVPAGRGMVSFFVELFNVFNHSNFVRVNGFDVRNGEVITRYESIIGVLPSFGVTWQF